MLVRLGEALGEHAHAGAQVVHFTGQRIGSRLRSMRCDELRVDGRKRCLDVLELAVELGAAAHEALDDGELLGTRLGGRPASHDALAQGVDVDRRQVAVYLARTRRDRA